MHSCVIVYRAPSGKVFGVDEREHVSQLREFADRDEALAYAETHLAPDTSVEIFELGEAWAGLFERLAHAAPISTCGDPDLTR